MRRAAKSTMIDAYLKVHLGQWVTNEELRRVSGVDDVPRYVRTIRQLGANIEVDGRGSCRLVSLDIGEAAGVRGPVVGALRVSMLERDGYRCRMCGAGPDTRRLVADHVLPVEHGGPTVLENLQTLCEQCNREKGARLLVDRIGPVLRCLLTTEQRQRLVRILAEPA